MDIMFVPAQRKVKVNKNKILELSKELPKTIAIAYSIQFKDLAFDIKDILSKKHEITNIMQVLGCTIPKFSKPPQAILLIGSGKFHAIGLAAETGLPIYILEKDKLSEISKEQADKLKKKEKAAYLKFLHANSVGILVSTKPGQENLRRSMEIRKKFKDKKFYLFLDNNINVKQFENFTIDAWMNSACPRLDMDYPIVNIANIERIIKN